jgi:hypothetical protein
VLVFTGVASARMDAVALGFPNQALRLPAIALQRGPLGSTRALDVQGPITVRSRLTGIFRLSGIQGSGTRRCESGCTITMCLAVEHMTVTALEAGSAHLTLEVPIERATTVPAWPERFSHEPAMPIHTVFRLEQSRAKGYMRIALTRRAADHWCGRAAF